jgi:hypothetical protein
LYINNVHKIDKADKCTAIMAGKSFHTVLNVVKMPVINRKEKEFANFTKTGFSIPIQNILFEH